MSIGQRILAARQEAGLSQRQLAGETITRNMLSALEHDKAKPSVDTLVYLSAVLGKPVGWFLGEDEPVSKEVEGLCLAREAYDKGRYRQCLEQLQHIKEDEVLGRECALLKALAALELARQALEDGRMPYARKLLETPPGPVPYLSRELERSYRILRARAGFDDPIPEDDTLLLRAEQALRKGCYPDAERYLLALDARDSRWNLLMGESLYGQKQYAAAASHYHKAEEAFPGQVRGRLQICYAELKDFEKAYYYATMK